MAVGGLQALRKIQWGVETTFGTPVAATARYQGALTHHVKPTFGRPIEERGLFANLTRSYQTLQDVDWALLPMPATYEQLPYILEMGVKGGVSPVLTAVTVNTWTYPFATTAELAPKYYTIETGDDLQAFKLTSSWITDFTIAGSYNGLVTVGANGHAQTEATTSFTGALTETTIEEIIAANGDMYLDVSWAALGTTKVAATLLDFSIKFNTMRTPRHYINGQLTAQSTSHAKAQAADISLTLEFNTLADAEYTTYWLAQTTRFMRLKFPGTVIAGSTGSVVRSLIMDMALKYDDHDPNNVTTGTTTVKVKASSVYDTTGASEAQFAIASALSALP